MAERCLSAWLKTTRIRPVASKCYIQPSAPTSAAGFARSLIVFPLHTIRDGIPLDARHYLGQAAPSHLFFQFARHDEFVPVTDGERSFALASSPKQMARYECQHAFNAQACLGRAIFLCEQLGVAQPSQEVLKLLERVPSPIPLEEESGA